jgi:hypothetical protein
MYGVYTVAALAGKRPYIRSCTVCIYDTVMCSVLNTVMFVNCTIMYSMCMQGIEGVVDNEDVAEAV